MPEIITEAIAMIREDALPGQVLHPNGGTIVNG